MTRIQYSALAFIVTALANVAGPSMANAQQTTPAGSANANEPTAAASAESSSSLEETFAQADELFQAADYAQAAALFTRVWQLAQTPHNHERWGRYAAIFAFNAATSYRLGGDCKAAHLAFAHYTTAFDQLPLQQQTALRDATDLPADNTAWLNDMTEECPQLHAVNSTAAAPSGNLSAANLQAAEPQPSQNTGSVTPAAGNWLLDVNLPAPVSAARPHAFDNDANAQQTRSSPLGWVLASAGAVSLAASGYFLWSGIQNNDYATEPANKHEPYKDYAAVRNRDYVTASILAGVGLGLAGVGVYMLGAQNQETDTTQGITHGKLWLFASGTRVGIGGEL